MIRRPFGDGWTVAAKRGAFEAIDGDGGARAVTVPHDAIRDLPRSAGVDQGVHSGYHPGGAFVYTKSFAVPREWREKTVLVEFEGAYRDAVVFVNGEFAGHLADGYRAFALVLDPYLRFGEDNVVTVETRAHTDSRWYSGSGIYRPVHLVVADPVHVPLNGVRVTTADVDAARAVVAASATVRNTTRHTTTNRIHWTILDPDGAVVTTGSAPITVLPGDDVVARTRLTVPHPSLWSPDSPSLYTARVELRGEGTPSADPPRQGDRPRDEQTVRFGIRTLQLDPQQGLRINGRVVKLRGACVHHDNGPLGAATPDAAEDRRIRLLKAAGFNAVRSAHNPASRAMLDACDRHGVLVMDELTDVWTRAKTAFDASLAFPHQWRDEVAGMVEKDINHPSVVMYSIGNEILELGTPIGATWSRRIAEEVRRLDPDRFVTNGINGIIANLDRVAEAMAGGDADTGADPNTMMAEMGERMALMNASEAVSRSIEESASVLDVVGFNYADSRYEADATDHPNRVIVGSETFPAHIDVSWAKVATLPHVIGDFTWAGWDYLGEAGIGRVDYTDEPGYAPTGTAGPFPYRLAETGDLDITGHRRTVSYYREIVFGLRTDPYIAVHRPQHHGRPVARTPWSWDDSVASWAWAVAEGSPVTVDVYADADEVELLLDGRSLGVAPVGEAKAFVARFETEWRPGELVAVARHRSAEVGRHGLRSSVGGLRLVARPESARTSAGDLLYVPLTIEDGSGTVVCDLDRVVTVSVEGGDLAGIGSGRAASEESFAGPGFTTYDGRVLAIVRATGPELTITASAAGLAPVTVRMPVA